MSQQNQTSGIQGSGVTLCEENSISRVWAKATTRRMQKGGDLHRRPLTRAEMTAPLAWHEQQMAVCRRYGALADGSLGYEVVA